MMKCFILSLCAACAVADVSHIVGKSGSEKDAAIVSQSLDLNPEGSYQWDYETANGIQARETGSIRSTGPEQAAVVVEGGARWLAPDGQPIEFTYTADENGYSAQGAIIPTPPPIPEAILRSLEFIRAHPPAPEKP